MRTEFDGAAYDRWLQREADRYWSGEEEEEETADEAHERMTDEEKTADAEWEKER